MKYTHHRASELVSFLWIAFFLSAAWFAPAARADEAADIVKAAGARGGLVVQVGCGDGTLTAELAKNANCLVQALDVDPAGVEKARAEIRSKGLYGRASVDRLTGNRLPYADNLVNLLISENLGAVPMNEVFRVLAPEGVAYVKSAGRWARTVKPRPKNIDEWTHFLYDATNNAVSDDEVVAPPYHTQWVAGPDTERSHDHLASLSTAVTSGGRLFYILDEGPVLSVKLPAQWRLVCRDAFSGVLLWKRQAGDWEDVLTRGARATTSDLARKLVALNGRVYVALGKGRPVVALDAATGRTVREYKGTEGTIEILCDGGRLYVVTKDFAAEAKAAEAKRRGLEPPVVKKAILALDAQTGRERWRKCDADTADLMVLTLAVRGDSAYYQNGCQVLCLDAATGRERWRAPRPADHKLLTIPTLVVWNDIVLSADNVAPGREKLPEPAPGMDPGVAKKPMPSELIAYSAKDGKVLWTCPYGSLFFSHVDVFVTDGGLWTGNLWGCLSQGYTESRNPATGEILKRRAADQAVYGVGCPHHRCYKDRATRRFIVMGRSGVEFFDVQSGRIIPNHWIRGTCQYGVLPANGLLYVPPHPCACYIEAKIVGFNALAPRGADEPLVPPYREEGRLEKGPAYDKADAVAPGAGDWPTYRHDIARSGAARTTVPTGAKQKWEKKLGGKVSSPVIADGKVFVAAVDEHAVHALDAAGGKTLWTYTAGARVDSPPTIHKGSVLFGSADGWVYCLRASDGQLAWRFQAAPEDRRVVAYEQVESAWPVHGSVLVRDDVVYFVAGRASYLEGGLYVYRLDARSGSKLSVTRIDSRDPKTGYQDPHAVASVGFDMEGALPDILSSKDGLVYMRHTGFDENGRVTRKTTPHLFNAAGFLDDSWFHRTYMIVGTRMASGFVDWAAAGNECHAGEILVVTDKAVYGYARNAYGANGSHPGLGTTRYRLFAADAKLKPNHKVENLRVPKPDDGPANYLWLKEVPLIGRAMALADDVLWVAGPPGKADLSNAKEAEAGLQGQGPGLLWAVSAADGRKLAEHRLDSAPVYDGMAAAGGRLYVSLLNGSVVCYGR